MVQKDCLQKVELRYKASTGVRPSPSACPAWGGGRVLQAEGEPELLEEQDL